MTGSRCGEFAQDLLFPTVHLGVRGKSPALESRQSHRRRRRNHTRVRRPKSVLGFVVVGNFHGRNELNPVKPIRMAFGRQPHHIFDLVLSWTWVSSPMTAS